MNKIETFESFLNTSNLISISLEGFILNLIVGTLMSLLIKYTYIHCGTSVSDRKNFANQFPLLLLITMFIITIVKSSLALSLGLVGALSIVRFRTAIKEPSELVYLFLCIGIGLGLGANQRVLSIIALFFILTFIWVYSLYFRKKQITSQNIVLTISSQSGAKPELESVINLLKKYATFVDLIRIDESENQLEAHFNIKFEGLDKLNLFRESLFNLNKEISLTILDNNNLI
jgi:hypothetical protein